MITLPSAAAMLALVVGAAASPSTFDGSRPLLCSADRGHDCTPGAYDCKVLEPQPDKPALFHIDFREEGNTLAIPHDCANRHAYDRQQRVAGAAGGGPAARMERAHQQEHWRPHGLPK